MMKEKLKIGCFLSGLVISSISTWYNRYGEIGLWEFHHQVSMVVSTMVVALLIRISTRSSAKIIGLYMSMGIISIQLIPIVRSLLSSDPTGLSIYALIYTLLAFLSSFIGGYVGEFLLKDEYKK